MNEQTNFELVPTNVHKTDICVSEKTQLCRFCLCLIWKILEEIPAPRKFFRTADICMTNNYQK